jgi:hypothetical protein
MAKAESKTYLNNWGGVQEAAKDAGAKFPELVAAQWALESGFGEHTSGQYNYFGIKGTGTACRTTEYINGARVHTEAEFMDFADLGECVRYLVTRWYKDWDQYEGVNRAATREAGAKELVKQGYATDPSYAEKLIKLMNEHLPAEMDVAPEVVKAAPRALLFQLVATQDTWLKKEPKQASELGDKEKVAVAKEKTYGVCAYTESVQDAHARVELAAGAGTWFVFEPHWRKVQDSGEAVPSSVDWEDFNCLVTPHLTVGEVLQWDRRRIPAAGSSSRARLVQTALEFEKVRVAWGASLGVTSFYRPEPINTQVGGVPNSKHITGEAVDVYPVGRSLESFYQWIRVRWTGGLGDGRPRGFVHLDTRGGGGFVPGAGVKPAAEWVY